MEKTKAFMKCPLCNQTMVVGKVEDKIVACCENKDCGSTFVFGEPMQKKFETRD